MEELHEVLIKISVTLLKPNGKLVFLFYTDEQTRDAERSKFPANPRLKMVSWSRDKLTRNKARHLLTYVKY